MSFLDIFTSRTRIEKDVDVSISRAIVCYKCDRELGEDHDDERCARKSMSRRFFLGGIAATAVGAVGVAAAVEAGLFGDKSREVGRRVAEIAPKSPTVKDLLRKVFVGDVVVIQNPSRFVTVGYNESSPYPSPYTDIQRGTLEKFASPGCKFVAKQNMDIYAIFDQYQNRVPFTVVRGKQSEQVKDGLLIGSEKGSSRLSRLIIE